MATLPSLDIAHPVAILTLRRPENANRLEPDDLKAVLAHIDTVNRDPGILVLQIRGEGKHFCSGYDISSLAAQAGNPIGFEDMANAVEAARPVTIAVIHGGAYGGGTDLALACDFRIGTHATEMFMPAARLGLHYYRGGLERYVTRLGLDTAKRLFLTAERIDARTMRACGFLTDLVTADELEASVERLTDTLAAMAPLALLGMKKHLNTIARGALDVDDLNADIARAAESEDLRQGAAAWAAKRPPKFNGR
jgi:enoyl-CoA hydratase/carnithine racemase